MEKDGSERGVEEGMKHRRKGKKQVKHVRVRLKTRYGEREERERER